MIFFSQQAKVNGAMDIEMDSGILCWSLFILFKGGDFMGHVAQHMYCLWRN